MNHEEKGTKNCYWMPTVIFNRNDINLKKRDKLIKFLNSKKIDSRVFFWPLSILPFYRSVKLKNKISYDLYYRGLNLPSYFDLKFDDQKRVVNNIINFLKLKKNV